MLVAAAWEVHDQQAHLQLTKWIWSTPARPPCPVQPAIEALLHPGGPEVGHACLRECVAAALAAAHNRRCSSEELCISGVWVLHALARRLAEAVAEAQADLQQQQALLQALAVAAAPQSGASLHVQQRLHSSAGEALALQQPDAGAAASCALVEPAAVGDDGPDPILGAWQLVLVPLADLAQQDPRPQVADAAASALVQSLRAHSSGFTPRQWRLLWSTTLLPLLTLPPPPEAPGALSHDGAQLQMKPQRSSSAGALEPAVGATPLQLPPTGRQWSTEGADRVERHASTHMPELWALLEERPAAGEALLAPALRLLASWTAYPSEGAAVLGINQLHQLLQAQAGAGRLAAGPGWREAVATLRQLCLAGPLEPEALTLARQARPEPGNAVAAPPASALAGALEAAAVAEGVRRRCRVAVLLQRVLEALLRQQAGGLPGQVQLELLGLLEGMVEGAAAFNTDPTCRAALALVLMTAEHAAVPPPASGGPSGPTGELASPPAKPSPEVAAAAVAAAIVGRRMGDSSDSDWEVVEAAGQATLMPRPAMLPPSLPDTPALVAGRGTAAGAGEPLLPALARQEAEGGCLYLASLQRCCEQPCTSDGSEERLREECASRLAAYCLRVVAAAAARQQQQQQTEQQQQQDGSVGSTAGAQAVPSTAAAFADQPWTHAVAAPLVEAALAAFASMPQDMWRRQQGVVFSHLAALMCSPSRGVRQALRRLVQRQMGGDVILMAGGGGGA